MSAYRIGLGLDLALEALDLIDPQPRSEGTRAAWRSYAADGSVHEEGLYIELEWGLLDNIAAYQSLLAQFGLDNAMTALVTIYAPGQDYSMQRFNGTAIRPEVGHDVRRYNYFLRDVTILIRNLVPAS